MSELLALVDAEVMGTVTVHRGGSLSFRYESGWLAREHAFPLSVSMPLSEVVYRHRQVYPFLWNLLPENTLVLQRWAQQFKVTPNNPFKLLLHVGEDVTGAAQFIPPARLEQYRTDDKPNVTWITIDELSDRMSRLRDDYAAFRLPNDRGRMSLAGVQAKTALYFDGKRWGVPAGRTPTTHILKPAIPGYPGIVENEHLILDIAARCGLLAAASHVLQLGEPVIVVERYDRLHHDGRVMRVHQEDLCQALSLMPAAKYQEEGGPGVKDIVNLLRELSQHPDEDVARFIDANIYNWLVGGADAHAKNYSLLIGQGGAVRLSPLYDLSSQLPYPDVGQRLAMKIGDRYEFRAIGQRDWRALAQRCELNEEQVIARIAEFARTLPDHISDARTQATQQGLGKEHIDPLAARLIENVKRCATTLKTVSVISSSVAPVR